MYPSSRRSSKSNFDPIYPVYHLTTRRTRAPSIAQQLLAAPPPPVKESASLDALPTEVLQLIASYVCDQTVQVKRKPGTTTTTADLAIGAARHHWDVSGFPVELLLINRRLYPVFFAQLWHSTPFSLSLSSSDALIFLKYALDEEQRKELRRIRLPRFMLSWDEKVGDDIWLSGHKKEPAFHAKLTWKLPDVPRVNNLVTHLSSRHPQLEALC